MDYLFERLHAAPCDEIRVVTRPEKVDVLRHAKRRAAQAILASPESVPASIVAALGGLSSSDIVLIGFPDTIWEPLDGFRPLIGAVHAGAEVALGLFDGREPSRSDVVCLGSSGTIERVVVKPEQPPSQVIWGCAAVRASVLDRAGDESELGVLFDRLCRSGVVAGVWLSDLFLDIGTPEALAVARRTPS